MPEFCQEAVVGGSIGDRIDGSLAHYTSHHYFLLYKYKISPIETHGP